MSVEVGVAPIPGVNGGESTFVGGDSIGISGHQGQRPGLELPVLADVDEAQVEVLAKRQRRWRAPTSRTTSTPTDPRLVIINQVAVARDSQTPYALNFRQAFNDRRGPGSRLLRNAMFGDGSSIDADNEAITEVLAVSGRSEIGEPVGGRPRSGLPLAPRPARGPPLSGSGPPGSARRRTRKPGLAYAAPTALFVTVFFLLPAAAGQADVAVATGRCSPATGASTPRRTTPTPSTTDCSGRRCASRSSTR